MCTLKSFLLWMHSVQLQMHRDEYRVSFLSILLYGRTATTIQLLFLRSRCQKAISWRVCCITEKGHEISQRSAVIIFPWVVVIIIVIIRMKIDEKGFNLWLNALKVIWPCLIPAYLPLTHMHTTTIPSSMYRVLLLFWTLEKSYFFIESSIILSSYP